MNKWGEVAKLFDLMLDEEFYVIGSESKLIFKFTDNGLMVKCSNELWSDFNNVLKEFIDGKHEIIKKAFKPKYGENYYSYSKLYSTVTCCVWKNTTSDYTQWKIGNCFRTSEEARTKGKKLFEQIVEEFENE